MGPGLRFSPGARGPGSELLLLRPTPPGSRAAPPLASRMMRRMSAPSGATPWTEDSACALTTSAAVFSARSHCRVAEHRGPPGGERRGREVGQIPGEREGPQGQSEASQCHQPAWLSPKAALSSSADTLMVATDGGRYLARRDSGPASWPPGPRQVCRKVWTGSPAGPSWPGARTGGAARPGKRRPCSMSTVCSLRGRHTPSCSGRTPGGHSSEGGSSKGSLGARAPPRPPGGCRRARRTRSLAGRATRPRRGPGAASPPAGRQGPAGPGGWCR